MIHVISDIKQVLSVRMREGLHSGYTIYNYGGGPNVTLSPDGSGGYRYYEW